MRTQLLLLTAVLAACSRPTPTPEAVPTVPVSVVAVSHDTIVQPIAATGTFGPRDEVPLSFKIGGVVARVMVDEGASVRRGQLLAALDLREIDAMVAKARAGFDKATRDLARIQRLHADSVATLAQLQDATTAADAARADLTTAQVNRDYATITAPSDGVILRRLTVGGTTTAPGVPVLLFGASDRGRVFRVGLPDRDAMRVRVGDAATARFDAFPDRQFTGRIALLGRAADLRTGTYATEIALANADALPAGLVGRVTLMPRASIRAAIVPVDALVEADADSAFVYTVSASAAPVAERRSVRILFVAGDRVAVEGLGDATSVVTRGASYLSTGTRVTITTVGDAMRVGVAAAPSANRGEP